ncbi:MAG: hypothetical protein AAGF98_17080 [Cyanobacteria bacterium P01_H01_bin.153]
MVPLIDTVEATVAERLSPPLKRMAIDKRVLIRAIFFFITTAIAIIGKTIHVE